MCQECKRRTATVHVSRVVNGQTEEFHLCEACARERGDFFFVLDPGMALQELLSSLAQPVQGSVPVPERACPECGMDYRTFAKTGRLGCPECYRHFHDQLDPLIRQVQGSVRHTGARPARALTPAAPDEVTRLRAQLAQAVEREAYEEAAALRDRIRALEKELEREGLP